MYSRKRVGPRMEPWGNPSLTGYSCEYFPSRTTQSSLLLRKKEIRPNVRPEIPKDLALWRRPACQSLSKALDISSAPASVAPYLLKALQVLSDTTARWSAFDREDLKPYWKSEKGNISLGDQQSYYLQVFKDFNNHRKKTNRTVNFSSRPFHNSFQYRDHQWDLLTIWKTGLFQTNIEELSWYVWKFWVAVL